MFLDAQSRHGDAAVVAEERPELLVFCGFFGAVGNLAPIVTIFTGWALTDHHFIAETISDLARGPLKWIMDLGFYCNACGLLALAIGATHAHLGRIAWSAGIFCLALLALVVVLLGLWDEFDTVGNNPPA